MVRGFFFLVLSAFLTASFVFSAPKPISDFFLRKLEKPKPVMKVPQVKPLPVKPEPVVIPPLKIDILGISGEEGARVGIINFKGSQSLVEEGDKTKTYEVMKIDAESIIFYHTKAKKRQKIIF